MNIVDTIGEYKSQVLLMSYSRYKKEMQRFDNVPYMKKDEYSNHIEPETANPNARGFWNKYFQTFA